MNPVFIKSDSVGEDNFSTMGDGRSVCRTNKGVNRDRKYSNKPYIYPVSLKNAMK